MSQGKTQYHAFSTRQAAALAGLSSTMVDYLCRTKIVTPTARYARRRGMRREYSFGDVVVLRAIKKLLNAGVEVSKLKTGLIALRKLHPEITPTSLPAALLVTDGKGVFLRHAPDVIEELSTGQYAFAFVLELRAVQQDILAKASKINRTIRKVVAT